MKFFVLTLGALALSTHQASADPASTTSNPSQEAESKNICTQSGSLRFNITEAGQSVQFSCDTNLPNLEPTFSTETPEMFEGGKRVKILEFLPDATFKELTADVTPKAEAAATSAKKYSFTVPTLPSGEHDLQVYCRENAVQASSDAQQSKDCQVTFHIASPAVRPVMAAAGAVAGVVASLLHFA
ncbi:SAG-related sequence SRS22F [Toxoplasma gondii ARI]|uniref:SAG-related sequence SRS22F n=1 Tax=Toxoplasma gondii ARI TaxID=1074872 RepID=A0A139XIV5_TOXGO|nr:SAG-related sequence SRS22F [Toxoplasma gondii ARI]